MDEKHKTYSVEDYQEATVKIKRSVFICRLMKVENMDGAKQFISRIAKENKTATHNCWAYILGDCGQMTHSSDDGEPSGTAGKPILNTLVRNQMTQVAAVVTRYFGGVKLGVRGLMEAYSESVQAAVDIRKLVEIVPTVSFCVQVSYAFNDMLISQISPFLFRITDSRYLDQVTHTLEIRVEHLGNATKLLEEYALTGKLKFTQMADSV